MCLTLLVGRLHHEVEAPCGHLAFGVRALSGRCHRHLARAVGHVKRAAGLDRALGSRGDIGNAHRHGGDCHLLLVDGLPRLAAHEREVPQVVEHTRRLGVRDGRDVELDWAVARPGDERAVHVAGVPEDLVVLELDGRSLVGKVQYEIGLAALESGADYRNECSLKRNISHG